MSNLNRLVFTALGQASMCWDPKPSSQVFDYESAMDIGLKLISDIESFLEEPKEDFSGRRICDFWVIKYPNGNYARNVFNSIEEADNYARVYNLREYSRVPVWVE